LRRYARALTGERSAADDLVQDTLERAWIKLHLWRTGSDLRAWLFTIMHNVHVNQVRSKSSAATLPLDDDLPDSPVRPTQADMLEVRDIDTALKRLPVAQREVLLLVALEHLSYQETADALGIPIGTVMSRLARARERLRVMLTGEAGGASLKVIK
jgi:RNA polymerase sigma-70 factor (ECF subfamily)